MRPTPIARTDPDRGIDDEEGLGDADQEPGGEEEVERARGAEHEAREAVQRGRPGTGTRGPRRNRVQYLHVLGVGWAVMIAMTGRSLQNANP